METNCTQRVKISKCSQKNGKEGSSPKQNGSQI